VQSTGLRVARGGMMLSRILADRIFRRRAFAPPTYKFSAQLATECVELGDYVWLSHPKVLDIKTGKLGLNSVVCEVIAKQPDYANGKMDFTLLDTRFISVYDAYQIVSGGTIVWKKVAGFSKYCGGFGYSWVTQITAPETYAEATDAERAQYMYISDSNGLNYDGTAGNTIF